LGPRAGPDVLEKRKITCAGWESKPHFVQPVA